MATKRVMSLLLSILLLIGLSACGTPSGGEQNSDNSVENVQGVGLFGTTNKKSIVPNGIYIYQDEMNNYINRYSGFLNDTSHIYFNDNFYIYEISTVSGELYRELRSATVDSLVCEGIAVEGTVFTHRGQLFQNNTGWKFKASINISGTTETIWPSNSILPNGEYVYFLYDPDSMSSGGEIILRSSIKKIEEIEHIVTVNGKEFQCLDFGDSEVLFQEDGLQTFGIYGENVIAVTQNSDYWVVNINSGESNLVVSGDGIQSYGGLKTFAVDGEYIFFTNDIEEKIERIRFDGTGRETVINGMNGSYNDLINISGGYLYHVDGGSLYRTNLADPTEQLVLAVGVNQGISVPSDASSAPYVVGDWVYYGSISTGYWRAKIDGTCTELITYAAYSENEQLWNIETFDKHNIAAGYEHTVAIRADGTVVATGKNDQGQCNVSDWTDIVSVYAMQGKTIGVKSDGTFCSTGGLSIYGLTNSIACDLRFGGSIAVKADGSVVGKCSLGGGAPNGWTSQVESWTDIAAAVTSTYHAVGLRSDGTVIAAGDNSHGQCDVQDWKNIIAVAVGSEFSVGLKADGTVVSVGNISALGWTNIVKISAANGNVIGLRADGTVITNNKNLSDWSNIVEICAGGRHYAGIRADGTVLTDGENAYGQCNTSEWLSIKTDISG